MYMTTGDFQAITIDKNGLMKTPDSLLPNQTHIYRVES